MAGGYSWLTTATFEDAMLAITGGTVDHIAIRSSEGTASSSQGSQEVDQATLFEELRNGEC